MVLFGSTSSPTDHLVPFQISATELSETLMLSASLPPPAAAQKLLDTQDTAPRPLPL